MKENYEIQNNVPEKSSLICDDDDDDIVCRWVGCILCPSTAIHQGDSGIRSGIGHQSGKETKTENILVHHNKILDGGQKCFFYEPLRKSGCHIRGNFGPFWVIFGPF